MSEPRACALSVTIAARIKAARLARNWSQQELAERAGVAAALVSLWETGHRNLTLANIEITAAVLDVDVLVLLGVAACLVCAGTPRPGYTCNTCGAGAP